MSEETKKEEVRLWVDDIRIPPGGTVEMVSVGGDPVPQLRFENEADAWVWARTFAAAQETLLNPALVVTEISIDNDLGMHDEDPNQIDAHLLRGDSPDGSGRELAEWMVEVNSVPDKITVHSWNEEAAAGIVEFFNERGFWAKLKPWKQTDGEAEAGL